MVRTRQGSTFRRWPQALLVAGGVLVALALAAAVVWLTPLGDSGTSPQSSGAAGSSASTTASTGSGPASPTSSTATTRTSPPDAAKPVPPGYPNASNTGVTPGTTLKIATTDPNYSTRSRAYFATRDGQVVQNLDIPGSIAVSADNVIIRNVRIHCDDGAPAGAINQEPGAENLTIEHVTIIGSRTVPCQYGVKSTTRGTTIRASNISLVSDAINTIGGTTVTDTYVHDMTFFKGDHVAAFGFDGGNEGSGPIVLRHNTFDDANDDSNNLIALYSQNGPIVNVTVDNNWLAGSGHIMWAGGYPADCSGSPGVHDVKITNNRFSTRYWPDGGSFGAVVGWCPHAPGNMWSGNVWVDGPKAGQPVEPN